MTGNEKESEVLHGCLEYLKLRGVFCWRQNTGAVRVGRRFIRFGEPGISDIIGVCPDGRFLAIECKRAKGGKVSEQQKMFMEAVKLRGGVALVVNSVESLESGLALNGVQLKKLNQTIDK